VRHLPVFSGPVNTAAVGGQKIRRRSSSNCSVRVKVGVFVTAENLFDVYCYSNIEDTSAAKARHAVHLPKRLHGLGTFGAKRDHLNAGRKVHGTADRCGPNVAALDAFELDHEVAVVGQIVGLIAATLLAGSRRVLASAAFDQNDGVIFFHDERYPA
jgi:hypothetical protein